MSASHPGASDTEVASLFIMASSVQSPRQRLRCGREVLPCDEFRWSVCVIDWSEANEKRPAAVRIPIFFELRAMNNKRWWRWFSCWFSSPFWAVAFYRMDRFGYLVFGRSWPLLRILLSPLLFILKPWIGYCKIHYRADIGKGLHVLHPTLGVVISGKAVCGQNLILTGGNCIGGKAGVQEGDISLAITSTWVPTQWCWVRFELGTMYLLGPARW
jgi:serine acetyltransferase